MIAWYSSFIILLIQTHQNGNSNNNYLSHTLYMSQSTYNWILGEKEIQWLRRESENERQKWEIEVIQTGPWCIAVDVGGKKPIRGPHQSSAPLFDCLFPEICLDLSLFSPSTSFSSNSLVLRIHFLIPYLIPCNSTTSIQWVCILQN